MGRDRASRPEAVPLRLFAAVDIPDRARRSVERAVSPWRERFPEGKWIRPENWHVTVKFLGRTWPRLVRRVHEACGEAASSVRPFRVSLEGLGIFPSPGRARVLWAGLGDDGGGLAALARRLDESLGDEFPPEKRPFTAHLTVARFNPSIPMRGEAEELRHARVDEEPFTVGHLTLYRSHLSPRGARYEALERFPLRG